MRSRQSGAVLIIAIGVLSLLAILGATFANLMRLEKQATQNYLDSQELDLVSDTALERVIAELRGADNWRSFTPYRATWLYKLKDEDDLAHGREPLDSPLTRPWEILATKQKNVYRYKVKVIDTSAQININGRQDTLGRMLDNLCRAIASSPRFRSVNPLYEGPNNSGQLLKGRDILQFRNKLEGNRFRSKLQLRELIGEENFEVLKDFICVEAFVDPYTFKPADGLDEIVEPGRQTSTGGGGRGVGGTSTETSLIPGESLASSISPEPRSPINLNTAPEEVLIAVLQGIAARRPFPYSRLNYTPIDQGATEGGTVPVGKEEKDQEGGGTSTIPRGVWVYSDRSGQGLAYDKARALAQRIIAYRKQNPFMCWSTGDANVAGGFAEFVNDLEESFFPGPENAMVVDPRLAPGDQRVDADVRRGGSVEMSRMWNKGHAQLERTQRKTVGLPQSPRNAFYYDMVRAMLIANANPNTRINRYNPDAPAYLAVDKSDLVRLDPNGQIPRKGHTTEFCFDTGGIYEVTSLAELAESLAPTPGREPQFRSIYQKPVRTVVKVFEVLRHTNQFHFEKTFNSGQRSSRSNRRYVVSCPDPMVALTDAMSYGSIRDGNVKLAGWNDGRRLQQTSASSRMQLYRSPESITAAMGFQDRDDTSYGQLRRMGRSPSLQLNEELRKVLGWNYVRKGGGKRYSEPYQVAELQTLGYNPSYLPTPPNVSGEQFGSDLCPDGYRQGLFTSTHLGVRPVHVVAHERMGFSLKSGSAMQVGAGNRLNLNGTVPYYQGGIAFWVKFEFDGDDPVFSGLLGCTQVVEDVGTTPKDSEGTQFYIFKNTEGDLRIVRMYYHQAFPDSTLSQGGTVGAGGAPVGTVILWPPVDSGEGEGGGAAAASGEGQNPILDHLDSQKVVARCDFILRVNKFRAHEWHHIAVDWNDSATANPLRGYVDFEPVQGSVAIRHDPQETPSAWVRLNVRRPRDEFFVGGFIRGQGVSDFGIFKWFTSSARPPGGARGVVTTDPATKRILANATIDEVIAYEGSFQSARSYYGQGGAPGYFSVQQGEYSNVFEVPLPPEVDYVVLRSFDWTSYYPTLFTTLDGQPHRVLTVPMQVQLFPGRENVAPFDEPWRPSRRNIPNPVANKRLQRREAKGLLGTNADMVYEFKMFPGKVSAGPLAGGSVQTPILDDVTLTYYLPDPKILLQEEAEDRPVRREGVGSRYRAERR